MGTLSKRVQVLFSKEKFTMLEGLAKRKKSSVGALIRKAVEEKYLKGRRKHSIAVLDRLARMNLPVDEWEKMEEEITLGALGIKKK